MSKWFDLMKFPCGHGNNVVVKTLADWYTGLVKGHRYKDKIQKSYQMAQEAVKETLELLNKHNEDKYGLKGEDWQRFAWAAEKAFCVIPGRGERSWAEQMASPWANPFSLEAQLRHGTE